MNAKPPTLTDVSIDEQTLDPVFTSPAGEDFSIGTNLAAKGRPVGGTLTIGFSSTNSYNDIGAAQRQEPAGGGPVANQAAAVVF